MARGDLGQKLMLRSSRSKQGGFISFHLLSRSMKEYIYGLGVSNSAATFAKSEIFKRSYIIQAAELIYFKVH